MRQSTKKLKSERGASMLFALMVFLLCLFAGVAALTAAAANVGRYTHLEQEQQQYLSVASALELVQKQLDDRKTSVTVQYIETKTWEYKVKQPLTDPPQIEREEATICELKLTDPATDPLGYYQYQLLLNAIPAEWWSKATKGISVPGEADPLTKLDIEGRIAAGTFFNDNYTIKLKEPDPAVDWADTLYPVRLTAHKPGGAAAPVPPGTPDAANVFALQMDLEAVTGGSGTDGASYPLHVVWQGETSSETNVDVKTTGDVPDPSTPLPPGSALGMPVDGSKGTQTTTTTLTLRLKWDEANRTVTFK